MGSRGVVLAVAFSSMATAAVGQALPASEPILARSDDVMAEAFAPFPLWGRSYLNWSDLPFTISATETTGYNDNILGLAQGQPLSPGTPSRGDFFSNTVFGASTKMYLGQQQFFADGTYGLTRYLTDSADNTHQYSLDAGLNWQIASLCSGRFIAAQNEYQNSYHSTGRARHQHGVSKFGERNNDMPSDRQHRRDFRQRMEFKSKLRRCERGE